MSKVSDFFSKLGIDLTGIGGDNSSTPIDPKIIEALNVNFKRLTEQIDMQNEAIVAYKKALQDSMVSLAKASNTNDVEKFSDEVDNLRQSLRTAQYATKTSGDALENLIVGASKANKIDPTNLFKSLKGFDSFENRLKSSTKELGILQNITNSFFSSFSKHAGVSFSEISKIITSDIGASLAGLAIIGELAAQQILELNDKLIEFGRSMGSVLNYSSLGYDSSGNSLVGGNSLAQNAGMNGVSSDQILNTYSAFKQGSGAIGSKDLENSGKELQKYGIEVAKMNKMYGVSADESAKVSKVLTQQYGKGIEETSKIMEQGAETAHAAGLNVGIFFENLSSIADLKGQLFVKGGAEGLEKAATALTRLGLGADKLSKLQDSYTGFTDLVEKQQKATAMGMNNLADIQARIFAKLQTGDTSGALQLKQIAGAKDIQGQIKDGKINQQGIQMLSSQGFDKDEIASIERVSRVSKELGISLDQVVTKNNLSASQKDKLLRMEANELTIKEKLLVMWSSIKSVIVDPLTSVLGPLLKIAIDSIVFTFDLLQKAFEPLILGIQQIGKLLNSVSGEGTISKLLGSILAVIISWKAFDMARSMFSSAGGFLSKLGGGKLLGQLAGSKLGTMAESAGTLFGKTRMGGALASGAGGLLKNINGKGFGAAAIGGLLGNVTGNLISNGAEEGSTRKKVGDTVSTAASWASTGAMLGSFLGPEGTVIGGIVGGLAGVINENWDGISDWFSKLDDTTKFFGEGVLTALNPIAGIGLFAADYWSKAKEQENNIKIASIGGSGGALPELSKIMEGKQYNTSYQQQSERENLVNSNQSNKPVVVNIVNDVHNLQKFRAKI